MNKFISMTIWLCFSIASHQSLAEQTDQATTDAARERLYQLFDEHWQHRLATNPEFASLLGDKRYNDQWQDLNLDAIEAAHQQLKRFAKRLEAIDSTQLSEADQLNYDLFQLELTQDIEAHDYKPYLFVLTQRGGVQLQHQLADRLSFQNEKDYQDWLTRMDAMPQVLSQSQALMNQGLQEKWVPARVVMQRVVKQLELQIVDDPENSPFFAPFKAWPNDLPKATQNELISQAKSIIKDKIIPSYQRFKAFYVDQYLPGCRNEPGIGTLTNGIDYYAFLTKRFTTTDLTPGDIHQLGLNEVKRIRAKMDTIIEQVGFKGSFNDFLVFLRTDPQFYYQTEEELLAAYQALSKRIDPLMVDLFYRLPRMPYGVAPIPDDVAPDTTTAYYSRPAADGSRAGTYYVNLYQPNTRPKYEMEALSLHEAVPGHHLQIAIASELDSLPNFRRFGGFTAFVEGWGLYAESLGEDIGLYQDPYSKFGQLTYEMWRAVRLVVDTGMHYIGWSREDAIEFFKNNAAKTENDIINEIDRYISWPGQALAYKVGELQIKQLRKVAQQTLLDNFDLKRFHDELLSQGALPLSVLNKRMTAYIDAWAKEVEQ